MSNVLNKIEIAKNLSGYDSNDLEKIYGPYTNPKQKITRYQHGRYVGKAIRLFDAIEQSDGPMDDLILAAKYLLVCIDSEKHQLDVKRFEIKEKIASLLYKYGFPVKVIKINKEA